MNECLLEKYQVVLKRSRRRKTLCLSVVDGEVRLNAPTFVAKSEINRFISAQTLWLEQQIEKQQTVKRQRDRSFLEGDVLPFLGGEITLTRTDQFKKPCCLNGKLYIPGRLFDFQGDSVGIEKRKKAIENWYRAQCFDHISNQVRFFESQMNICASSVKVRAYKRRWGSCGPKGDIQFNWHLIMAPEAVIDYVVVHELAHIRVFDHSKTFWALVGQYCADYKTLRAWLRSQTVIYW